MPGRYIATGLYSEVVVNRGSTVEDILTRMDLGRSRYCAPFTTEQLKM